MRGFMMPNSKPSNRVLKKSASVVLAPLRDSTYRKGTPRWTSFLSTCGLSAIMESSNPPSSVRRKLSSL